MDIYLVQHGEAKKKKGDPQRSLTDRGKADVGRVAKFTADSGIWVSQIRHSGKDRAEATASIFAEHLSPNEGSTFVPGLAPMDDIEPVAEALNQESHPLLIVGHLPFLSKLASYLITGQADLSIIYFQMGGIVCLKRDAGEWAVRWIMTPDLLP